jgi:hypothetical protein
MQIVASSSALAILVALTPVSLAHGPWPHECCHDRDCAEVSARHVVEEGDTVRIVIPPGTHPMWPADGRAPFVTTTKRDRLRKSVTGEWGVCISPSGALLCVFPPALGG